MKSSHQPIPTVPICGIIEPSVLERSCKITKPNCQPIITVPTERTFHCSLGLYHTILSAPSHGPPVAGLPHPHQKIISDVPKCHIILRVEVEMG